MSKHCMYEMGDYKKQHPILADVEIDEEHIWVDFKKSDGSGVRICIKPLSEDDNGEPDEISVEAMPIENDCFDSLEDVSFPIYRKDYYNEM